MTNEERLTASIEQIKTFNNSQFIRWHLAAVKFIRKLLLNLDVFYGDLLEDLELEDVKKENEKTGWKIVSINTEPDKLIKTVTLDPSVLLKKMFTRNQRRKKS